MHSTNVNPRTFWANRDLVITAGLNFKQQNEANFPEILKYCNFERCCGNEIRYILKHYMYLNYCLSAFLLSLDQLSNPIFVTTFGIEKVF